MLISRLLYLDLQVGVVGYDRSAILDLSMGWRSPGLIFQIKHGAGTYKLVLSGVGVAHPRQHKIAKAARIRRELPISFHERLVPCQPEQHD